MIFYRICQYISYTVVFSILLGRSTVGSVASISESEVRLVFFYEKAVGAKPTKIRIQSRFRNNTPNIREGKTCPSFHFMSALSSALDRQMWLELLI
jgi:hypothetical protein